MVRHTTYNDLVEDDECDKNTGNEPVDRRRFVQPGETTPWASGWRTAGLDPASPPPAVDVDSHHFAGTAKRMPSPYDPLVAKSSSRAFGAFSPSARTDATHLPNASAIASPEHRHLAQHAPRDATDFDVKIHVAPRVAAKMTSSPNAMPSSTARDLNVTPMGAPNRIMAAKANTPPPTITHTTARIRRPQTATRPPFATHYQASTITYESLEPTQAAEMMDRYGYHYEGLGDRADKEYDDASTKHQTLLEQERYRRQLQLQMDERKRRVARTREQQLAIDDVTSTSIPDLGDDAARQEQRRRQRKALEQLWLTEADDKRARDAAEREALKPWEENWNILEAAARRKEMQGLSELERLRKEEELRLQRWKFEQVRKADEIRFIEEERQRVEELTLGPNIANYAERIVLAEQQRKRDQELYRQQLDEQIREKHLRNQRVAAEQYQLECRLGAY